METLPKTFEEYLGTIAKITIELSTIKKVRNKTIFSFFKFTISLIAIFIFIQGMIYLNTLFKQIVFTLFVFGLIYTACQLIKKLTSHANQDDSQPDCVTGCLGFFVYLIKKPFLFILFAAAVYWISMLLLDELFGIYYLFDNDFAWLNITIIVFAIIALTVYISCIYRLITSILSYNLLKEQEHLLEEYYRENSLALINASTTHF